MSRKIVEPIKIDPIKERVFQHAEQLLGLAFLFFILLGCMLVLKPFFSVMLWSAILCYATWPAYEWLIRKLRFSRTTAALIMTTLLVVMVALPIAFISHSLADGVEHLLNVVRRLNREGLPEVPPNWIKSAPWIGDHLQLRWAEFALNAEKTSEVLREILLRSRGWLLRNSLQVGQGVLQVCLSVIVAFFIYRDGHQAARRMTEASSRIMGVYTQNLINLVGLTIKAVVYGLLGAALAQGIVAAIGFSLAGVPAPYFWAMIIILLALIPAIGPSIIWISASIWLLTQGFIGRSIFMALWGFIGISGIENVVRPYLISRTSKLSFLTVFFGVLGGLLAFGLIGIFLGPTLLAVGISLTREFSVKRAEPESGQAEEIAPKAESGSA